MPAQVIDLSNLAPSEGFIIQGDAAYDNAGRSVSNAGDVNGDGIDDLIVGANFGDDGGSNAGEAYVIFGRTTGFGSLVGARQVLDLTTLSASDGFIIQGDTGGDQAGLSVSSVGDVNGDGIADLIVGATGGDDGGSNAGEAYVIFGRTTGFGSAVDGRQVIDLTTLSASDGFIIQGDVTYDRAGVSVSSAGDINGDGIDDLIVGADSGTDGGLFAGEAYVIFGRTTGFGSAVGGRQVIDLTTLSASDGFIIQGDTVYDSAGRSVSNAGDVNGDGIDDLIVGASGGSDGGTSAGEAYVIFGRSTGFGSLVGARRVLDLTSLSASDGFIIQGDAAYDNAGRSVSNAGDVNGDGIDDLIIGAEGGDVGGNNAGGAYVIFGRTTGFGSAVGGRQVIDLTTLSASDGFIIQGDTAGDGAGFSVSNAGDVNGDGIADLIVGAGGGDNGGSDAGEAYVIFGRSTGFGSLVGARRVLDLTNLSASDGFIIQGDEAGDRAGVSVCAAGDVNDDGIDDLIVGANSGDDGGTSAGEAYVIFGSRNFGVAPPITGTTGNDTLTGTAGADTINGLGGNDVLDGGAGADTMRGGADNDVYVVDNAGDSVEELASEGTDRVETNLTAYTLTANVENLEYTGAAAFTGSGNGQANHIIGGAAGDALSGIDGDDTLGGEAGNDTLDGGNGNDRLIGGTGVDTLNGGAGDDILVVDHFADGATGGDGRDTLQIDAGAGGSFGQPLIETYQLAADIEVVQVVSAFVVSIRLNALDNLYGGGSGTDAVDAGDGNDIVYGRGAGDFLSGDGGNDRLFGEAGNDQISGGDGNDLLYGGADNDTVIGDAGNDSIYGEAGNDNLRGGLGVDLLYGGAGADTFFYFAAADSGPTLATADRIRDFAQVQGDRINLQQIDANAVGGAANDAFSFIGSAAFSNVAGQLRVEVVGGETRVSGDVNGDGVADFLIRIDGVHALSAADFVL